MTGKKVFLITGAGRGMGTDIVRSALAAGHAVVATGRNPDRVSEALGTHPDLLITALDVTDPASARTAVEAAAGRFGRIDVLVNNAGNFYAGFFEEITPQDFRAQVDYIDRTKQTVTAWSGMDGQQGGDPAKLAEALI